MLCTGAFDCDAPVHRHGCFRDDPCPHPPDPVAHTAASAGEVGEPPAPAPPAGPGGDHRLTTTEHWSDTANGRVGGSFVVAQCTCGWQARVGSHTHGQQAHDRHVTEVRLHPGSPHQRDELARIFAKMRYALRLLGATATADVCMDHLALCDPDLHDAVVLRASQG